MMRSVEVREEAMSLALPLRLGDVCEDAAQFLEVEVLVRDARIEPAKERLSAVLVANEAVEAAREGVAYGEGLGKDSTSRSLPFPIAVTV